MKKTIISLLFCLVVSTLVCLADTIDLRNTVSARGDGVVEVAPDQAKIDIGVVVIGDELRTVQQQNNEIMAKVKKQLLLSADEKNITTGRINVYPLWDSGEQGKKPQIKGYQSENSVTVVIDNFETIGTILNLCVSAGANQIGDIRFMKKDRAATQSEALKIAVIDALRKAEIMATSAGRKLGKTIVIRENSGNNYSDDMIMFSANKGGAGMGGSVSVSPGALQFKASVEVICELQ